MIRPPPRYTRTDTPFPYTTLSDLLKYKDDSAIGPSVRLGLAESYRHLNRQKEAIPILTVLAENAVDKEVHDDALYMLAWCQMDVQAWNDAKNRSEEHTSELQSLMRHSYAVFCLKKTNIQTD